MNLSWFRRLSPMSNSDVLRVRMLNRVHTREREREFVVGERYAIGLGFDWLCPKANCLIPSTGAHCQPYIPEGDENQVTVTRVCRDSSPFVTAPICQ
jgi:hypothetical protein